MPSCLKTFKFSVTVKWSEIKDRLTRGLIKTLLRKNSKIRIPTPPLLHDLIIASPKELDEAEPVAEGIGHESELAPLVRGDGLL